jgi:MraZ protein
VFLGEYQHNVDEKGRVVMPSKFRDRLEDGLVVTKGQEHCLYVFPMDLWEEEVAKVRRLARTNRSYRNYARTFFGSASDQQMDKQGRVQIPPSLRSYGGLEKDIVVVGVADRVEIWDAAAWTGLTAEADEIYAAMSDTLSEEEGI